VERPLTAAEQRAAEVRARRAPRPDGEPTRAAPPPWEKEQWVDDGPLRQAAEGATARAATPATPPTPARTTERRHGELAPEIAEELARVATPARVGRYQERLATAADALDRGRYEDARRLVQPVLREVPDLAFAHELAGLASYRLGQWRKAATELEAARLLDGTLNHHAVLADSYRALRRYHEVEELWRELRDGSPAPALLAEGRIVAAGAQADRGDLPGALRTMAKAETVPKKVREHHLRQWYVIADLSDRSGDVMAARRWFGLVAQHDADFADVQDRLRSLGR
jgi:tetratricopeptide (TPR) repeat protein